MRFSHWLAHNLATLQQSIKLRALLYEVRRFPRISKNARFGPNVTLIGPDDSIVIGDRTYINDAIITAGYGAEVIIGKQCAIGYRVSIKAVTHDKNNPYPDEFGLVINTGKTIRIGDYCWIGDNVYIREGVSIGNSVIVGANSVVTTSIPDNSIIAGVPARQLRVRRSNPQRP
jgi:maltose O-acetyltransferase